MAFNSFRYNFYSKGYFKKGKDKVFPYNYVDDFVSYHFPMQIIHVGTMIEVVLPDDTVITKHCGDIIASQSDDAFY